MSKKPRAQHHLSDLQSFLVANLREQTKLKAELAQLLRSSRKAFLVQRIAKLREELVTLELVMNLRCQREESFHPKSADTKSSGTTKQNSSDAFSRLVGNAH
jgi:hypothetical protein